MTTPYNANVIDPSRRLGKLRTAMDWSIKKLETERKHRLAMLKQYVGFYYGEQHAADKVPINYLELSVLIFTQLLAATAPRVMVSTKFPHLQLMASDLALGVNHLIANEIPFRETLQRCVTDAQFGLGIVKVGLAEGPKPGFTHDTTQPFCDTVSLDDWVHDCTAKFFEQCEYAGDKYILPYEAVMESDLYDKAARDKLKPSQWDNSDPKARGLVQGSDVEEYYEHVELWDIWLPMERKILTLPAGTDGDSSLVLREVDWDGPENGPYHLLSFYDVPDNIMPLSPLAIIRDLHESSNLLYNKLARQAERQKTVSLVRRGADEDGIRRIEANDGDMIGVDDPSAVGEASSGGPNQTNLAFFLSQTNLMDMLAGNLKSLGGLAPSAETLGQDQMLAAANSKRAVWMQDRVYNFVLPVIRDLACYLFYDPLIDLPLTARIGKEDVPIRFNAEMREGDFLDYNLSIEPFSLQRDTPQTKLALVNSVLQNLIPLMPIAQQQGVVPNIEGYLKLVGKLGNLPELESLVTFGAPQQQAPSPVGTPPLKAAMTTRRYERVNRGGVTTQGKQQAMISTLLGAKTQPKEANMALTPMGGQ